MGNAQGSTTGADKPLIAQRHFEGTIHRRFVKDTVITLEFEDNFWSEPRDHPAEVQNVTHNKVLFKVPPVSRDDEQPKRKLLLDAYGVPVVGMEEHDLPSPPARQKAFAVIPDGYAATRELFRFETRLNVFTDMPLQLSFSAGDSSEAPTRVMVIGRWLTRQVPIAIQRNGGDFFMIARVYPVGDPLDGKYRMDVAPGVDLALMVLFAAAMDQETHKFERSSDRLKVKRLLKEEARREKQRRKAQQKAEELARAGAATATVS